MQPFGLIQMTPEDEKFLGGLLAQHRARWESPLAIQKLESGFVAKRAQVAGFGSTEREAMADLSNQELVALIASVPIKKKHTA